jgi:hypothetical protein
MAVETPTNRHDGHEVPDNGSSMCHAWVHDAAKVHAAEQQQQQPQHLGTTHSKHI